MIETFVSQRTNYIFFVHDLVKIGKPRIVCGSAYSDRAHLCISKPTHGTSWRKGMTLMVYWNSLEHSTLTSPGTRLEKARKGHFWANLSAVSGVQ